MSGYGQRDQNGPVPTRPFALGPFVVRLECDLVSFAVRWDELFAGFPDAAASLQPLVVSVAVDPTGALHSSIDGVPVEDGPDPVQHELAITRALNHRKLDAEVDLVHFHAAAVAQSGRAVVMAGRSGDGKSTLTARLVQAGWDYVTDEQVTLDQSDEYIVPYPRPLTLRRGVWHLFPGIGDGTGGSDYRRVETSMRELGGRAAVGLVRPGLVLAPRYERLAADGLSPFGSTAEVVEFLVSCCHDLERTGTRGLAAIVHLASTCPAYRLRFSDVDTAMTLVQQALSGSTTTSVSPPRRLDTPDGEPTAPGALHRRPASTAWLFGDGSGVVFHPTALCLARLDTLGCALWEVLAEPDTIDAIAADAPDAASAEGLRTRAERLVEGGLLVVA